MTTIGWSKRFIRHRHTQREFTRDLAIKQTIKQKQHGHVTLTKEEMRLEAAKAMNAFNGRVQKIESGKKHVPTFNGTRPGVMMRKR